MESAIFYEFDEPLIKGMIMKRPNRFIMLVEVAEEIYKCHCPCTGRIGDVIFNQIPCLLSKSNNPERKTAFTVEAISVDHGKNYIGINQNAANRYVEFYLKSDLLHHMVNDSSHVKREQTLGNSRLDFKVGDTYIEVKTPLIQLQTKLAADIKQKQGGEFESFERFIKHIHELSGSLKDHERAILLSCFLYDNPGFVPPRESKHGAYIQSNIKEVLKEGVELWQINLAINQSGVRLLRCFRLVHMFE